MLAVVACVYGVVLPQIPQLRIAPRVAEVLIREGATRPGDAIMIDYKEASLAFYQGGTIRPEGDNNFLVNTSAAAWPRWIVMTDAIWRRMPESVRNQLNVVESVQGLNYAGKDADKQHRVTVHVLRKR